MDVARYIITPCFITTNCFITSCRHGRLKFNILPAQEQTFNFKLLPKLIAEDLKDAVSFEKLKQVLEFRLEAYPTITYFPDPVIIQPKMGNYKSIKELIRYVNGLPQFKKLARLRCIFVPRGI